MCGTFAYLAPEAILQNLEEGYENLVDSWSVGVVVFSMLTGAFPFEFPESSAAMWEPTVDWQVVNWQALEDAVLAVDRDGAL
ncbi:hypothetical protein V5O48_004068 [Marasmius crinis-equi]|uniref:Protein kinase domain-containing protein n=1 Tax=Marasmius crinis-equi TaxID=585013 RepID=A0ABR3FR41_9AGAR